MCHSLDRSRQQSWRGADVSECCSVVSHVRISGQSGRCWTRLWILPTDAVTSYCVEVRACTKPVPTLSVSMDLVIELEIDFTYQVDDALKREGILFTVVFELLMLFLTCFVPFPCSRSLSRRSRSQIPGRANIFRIGISQYRHSHPESVYPPQLLLTNWTLRS